MTSVQNSSPAIQQIDKSSVHKICSGQVVLDLATAVKELIENSLDAGANQLEIKLKEYGKELIEVSDNGVGIEEENFEGLALKHHTSKLREFNDLTLVSTYGFRGEALSSLSALSDLNVVTQNEKNTTGFRLEFDHNGKLKSTTPTAREKGTTVMVANLFYTLPVRYKEFQRNFKKDFGKLCHVIYAYSLVNSNVRFSCVNIVGKKKSVIVSTKGNIQALDVTASLFGLAQAKKLVPFAQTEVDESIAEEYNLSASLLRTHQKLFNIRGYISSVTHGCGRSSPDRQFFYVNSRPCDHQKLSRTVNEVYRTYNNSQYPFVFMEVLTNKEFVDVNITPDKRQVMLQQEKILFAVLKSSLKTIFDNLATYYNENKSSQQETGGVIDKQVEEEENNSTKTTATNPLSKFKSKYAKATGITEEICLKVLNTEKQQPKLNRFFTVTPKTKRPLEVYDAEDEPRPKKYLMSSATNEEYEIDKNTNSSFEDQSTPPCQTSKGIDNNNRELLKDDIKEKCIVVEGKTTVGVRPRQKVNFNLNQLKESLKKRCDKFTNTQSSGQVSSFRAKILTNENDTAEEELKRHVSKESFSKMKVLGQFNLGFIIAKLDRDLFIVDQHASDEKYNFETLQKKHVLKTQLLIQPLPLELTPFQRNVLSDNIDIFKKNGFAFDISEENCVKLVSQPVHRNWNFGVSDVEELIFILSDSPGSACRPSRVRQMFASRACRTSIMVGTALSKQKMLKLLSHMGEIEHPWNCPHGRPTMRHLINLQRLEGVS